MGLSFNLIPGGLLTPGVFVEFDTSKAQQGPSIQNHVALLVGQRLSTGTKAAGTIDLITSASQARDFYGPGSMLSAMVDKFLIENKINQLNAIAVDDDGAGVFATGTVTMVGSSIEAGTLALLIAGRSYKVAVAAGDALADIATALAAAITADDDKQITASPSVADVNLTYVHKGEVGNSIDIRLDPAGILPKNLTATIVGFASGATIPVLTSVITAMGETQFHEIGAPYTDATSLGVFQTEMVDRWGPLRQNDGQYITARRDSVSNQSTFADGRNNEQETVADMIGPNGPHEWAANLAAIVAREAQIDPGRPMQTVVMRALLPPLDSEVRTQGEANGLLLDGMTTFKASAGQITIQRVRTTRKKNNFDAPDQSLADLNPKQILSFQRFDFRTRFTLKFARHKLSSDGVRFGPGQNVITPRIAKAEIITIFRDWEELGLVEGIDQFKRDLIVERNLADPNRLDVQMPPDLINQLRVTAAQIAFLL